MTPRFLMCPPDHFSVQYAINPWMKGQFGKVDEQRAKQQWTSFFHSLESHAEIKLLEANQNVPDLVFTANAGAIRKNRVVLSHFTCRERQPEEPLFRKWFSDNGYEIIELGKSIRFEGTGDALFQPGLDLLWAGHGFRTDREAHNQLAQELDVSVVSLHLIDPRFYHLDTCFCPLPDNKVMYYPPAFSTDSVKRIGDLIEANNQIIVSSQDAMNLACNAVLIGHTLHLNAASKELQNQLMENGLDIRLNPVTEFLKAGGANKCLTIALH